jgi:hypothetical protein
LMMSSAWEMTSALSADRSSGSFECPKLLQYIIKQYYILKN